MPKVRIVNELVSRERIPAGRNYAKFAAEQIRPVNRYLLEWLARQSFASYSPDPTYGEIKIEGSSNYLGLDMKPYQDCVSWSLRFNHKVKEPERRRHSLGPHILSDALLHIDRLPDVSRYNSGPRFFSTLDYIDVRVENGERGWVKQGIFPVGPHIKGEENSQILAFTDTRRNAEVGFRAAIDWAKFRTMAIACSSYALDLLKREKIETWEDGEAFRYKMEKTITLMVQLFPDTRKRTGPSSLKPYYEPGILETTVAFMLGEDIDPNFGPRRKRRYPIHYTEGSPVEIFPRPGKKNEYDAVLPFRIALMSSVEGEEIGDVLERHLSKRLPDDFKISFKGNYMYVRLHVPEAHKTIVELKENKKTELQRKIGNLSQVLHEIDYLKQVWEEDQMPAIKQGYQGMVDAARQEHFGKIRTWRMNL